jgi:molybdopterin converting factor small subunit
MKIEMNLYASLSRYAPDGSKGKRFVMEITEETKIRELLDQLKVPKDAVKMIFLNGVHAGGDASVKDGDRLGVFPPVAGG